MFERKISNYFLVNADLKQALVFLLLFGLVFFLSIVLFVKCIPMRMEDMIRTIPLYFTIYLHVI